MAPVSVERQHQPGTESLVERMLEGERLEFGYHGAVPAEVDDCRKHINALETELEIIDLKNSVLNQVVGVLRDTQSELLDVRERLKAAEDIMLRTDIRAPQAGVVMGLNVHTEAGVIAPGQRLLDIVPEDDTLVIEAQVTPNDIDVVYAGLPAQVRLTAFKQRNTPLLDGKLTRVSADSFTDERSGASYFLARVTIDAAELKKLDGRELYPGMGAEVMIKTGKRTTMDYILAPLTDSLRRAFRED